MVNAKEIAIFFGSSVVYAALLSTIGIVMAIFWEAGYTCDAIKIGDVFKKFGHVCDSDLNKAITYSLINYAGKELKPIKLCDNDITKWLKSLDKKNEKKNYDKT